MMIFLNKSIAPLDTIPERTDQFERPLEPSWRRRRVRLSTGRRQVRYRLIDAVSSMPPTSQRNSADYLEDSGLERPRVERIPIQYREDDEEENSRSLRHDPLFSARHGITRKSLRSQSVEDYRHTNIGTLCQDFCHRTSSHGIPFLGTVTFFGKLIWALVFVVCLTAFLIQTFFTFQAYFNYRTIMEMQLIFRAASFPAVTICNLNPYKYSELTKYPEIKQGLEKWEHWMNVREMAGKQSFTNSNPHSSSMERKPIDLRWRRALEILDNAEPEGAEYQPVFVRCTCLNNEQCVPNRNPLEVNASVCMCFEDITKGHIWPCYPTQVWTVKKCQQCSVISNTCSDPDRGRASSLPFLDAQPCLCQSISHHCMVHPKGEIRWWNPNNYTIYRVTEPPPIEWTWDGELEYGFDESNDTGTLTTKTKENLIYMVSHLPKDIRKALSYSKDEFVKRCTFNMKDCLEDDFKMHIDPEYGNCFTFNYNDSVTKLNSRAGPVYGLRILLDVHQDDYLVTTEAAGVRIVVHEQHQEPFPDTFGYSAPVGFVSSFGLKAKMLKRKGSPYSDCSDKYRPEDYIYEEHYSPEGCRRDCFQHAVLQNCSCGDPRYPLPKDDTHRYCFAKSKKERECVSNFLGEGGGHHNLVSGMKCECIQPCTETVFETSFSAAAWPSKNVNFGLKCQASDAIFNDSVACLEYYKENTALIEIYYEQLNYETLNETAAYNVVSLFSDLGGNIGLWIGFSVITMVEICELLVEIGYYSLVVKPRRLIRLHAKKKMEREKDNKRQTISQILDIHRQLSRKSAQHLEIKRKDSKGSDDQMAQVDDEESEANLLKSR